MSTNVAKRCTGCGITKSLDQFGPNKTSPDQLQARCRNCRRDYCREYRKAKPHIHREADKRYYEANRDLKLGKLRKWQEANIEHRKAYREEHREEIRERREQHYRENRDSVLEYSQVSRRRRQIGSTKDYDDYLKLMHHDPCAYCGKRRGSTLDHIVPVSAGGALHIDNVTAACLSCNSRKQDTSLLQFLLEAAWIGNGVLS